MIKRGMHHQPRGAATGRRATVGRMWMRGAIAGGLVAAVGVGYLVGGDGWPHGVLPRIATGVALCGALFVCGVAWMLGAVSLDEIRRADSGYASPTTSSD